MAQYIYLLQEREFVTTKKKIYKLGKTKQDNLRRFKQYPKGSKLLLQQICPDCDILETQLIIDFKNKYIHKKDIGNEYFEGDYNEMIKDIQDKITDTVASNEDTDENDDEDKPQIDIDDEVKELFPNYCDDETFGGTKKLIKIFIELHKISIKYIDCDNYQDINNYMVGEDDAYRDEFDNTYFKHKDNYYDKLIKHKVIENNKIYDLNDIKFIKKLDKYKHNVRLHYSDKLDYINHKYSLRFNKKHSLIEYHMQNNAILNENIYCSLYARNLCHIHFICKDWFETKDNYNTTVDVQIYIKNINGYRFDEAYLKRYSPYCINSYDSGEYYMLNRDYKIIMNEDKSYPEGKYKQIYLHEGNETPWAYDDKEEEIKMLYLKVLSKLDETTANKICKNENQQTNLILTKCI